MGPGPSEDVAILKDQLKEAFEALKSKDRTIRELKERVEYLLRKLFGRRSEKIPADQLVLAFLERDLAELAQASDPEADDTPDDEAPREKQKKNSRRNGRVLLPDHLPRERIVLEPEPEQCHCPHCEGDRVVIGEEVTEELDFRPGSFFVRQYVRPKYACRRCDEGVAIADPPPQVIVKGRPGPGLLAEVVVSKYGDHLPLNRQTGIFKRSGVDLPRSTLCDWVGGTADLLRPIVEAMKREIFRTGYVNTDDTPVRVHMGKGARGRTKEGRLWAYVSSELREVVFDFTMSRAAEGPEAFLDGYEGYLQADAYGGYDRLFRDGRVVEVGCMAHARRKFYDALDSTPEEASLALAIIRGLYDIEDNARTRGVTGDALRDLRREMAVPVLGGLKGWLRAERDHALPQSPLGKAIGYALNHWSALETYTTNGRLAIDNNAAERVLRAVAVGRSNWIFCGSPAGGRRAAILYSIVQSCKLQGIDPFAYVRDVLGRLHTHPMSAITELTPAAWSKEAHAPAADRDCAVASL